MSVNYELGRMTKEVIVADFKMMEDHFPELFRKTSKNLKIISLWVKKSNLEPPECELKIVNLIL
jgi:hypothetical protein